MTDKKVSDWEDVSKSSSEWEDVPNLAKKEPSLGEHLYGGAYGLGTSVLGGIGDIESMVTAPAVDPKLRVQETVFPTTENVRTGLSKIGVPKPASGTEPSVTLGEFVPAIAGGAQLAKSLGTYGFGKAADFAKTLMGRKTASQAGEVGKEAAAAGKSAEEAIAKQEKSQQQALAQSAEKQSQAERAAQKAAPTGERSLRELAGVKTVFEGGQYKPIPETPQKIGEFIRTQADNFLNSIKSQRSKAADVNFTKATIGAKQKEAVGQFVDTAPLLAEMDALIAKGGTTDYLNSIQRLRNDVAATKGFEGLEVIRRRLGDAAYGLPEEGYKAIGQRFSQKMYDDLAGQMRDFDKSFAKYLDDYKRLSEPIRVYGTKVGKSLTQTEDAAGRYIAKTPEKVAEEMFSSPQNFDRFVEAVGGNTEIATAAARRYFAGKLETAKTPEAVEKILRDNRELLKKIELTGAKQDIEKYLSSLKQASTRTEAAKSIATEAKELDKVVEQRLKGVSKAKTLMSDAVESLSSAKPGKAIETFENSVLPKIREAETQAGTRLLSDQQINTLRQQVQKLEQISDKTQRTRVISGILGSYVVGQAGVSKIKQLLGSD